MIVLPSSKILIRKVIAVLTIVLGENASNYIELPKQNPTHDDKDLEKRNKRNALLAKAIMIHHKIGTGSNSQKQRRQFTTITNKLTKVNFLNKEIHDVFLSEIQRNDKVKISISKVKMTM